METIAVTSTTLSSVVYDATEQLLDLEFRSRVVYRFFGVPADVHAGLLSSASKGAYFNQVIRNRYAFTRRSEDRA
jgi:hypothetical protein